MKKKNKNKKSSPLTPLPLQIWNPGASSSKELQIVEPTSPPPSSSPFQLPPGWSVEERPRLTASSYPGHVDKFYYEPGTGRKFRSLVDIQRHLSRNTAAEITPMPKHTKNMQIVTTKSGALFGLPDHWVVEEKPRENGVIDRFYLEPATELRFRSRVAAERYLKTGRKNEAIKKPKAGNQLTPSNNSGSQKKQIYRKKANASSLDSTSPPAKVRWVLDGPRGSIWNPFLGESKVPESVKQQWSETFVSSIHP